jgi:phosphohistidine swiveling domain-containing protein
MNIESINPDDYEELFRIDIPFSFYYVSELFMYKYKNLDCLLIYKDGVWQTLLPKKTFNALLKEGANFFKDKEEFLEYKEEFNKFMKESQKFLEKYKELPKKITKQMFDEITKTIRKHWMYYYKTEFFYSNQAYIDAKESNASEILKKNLEVLEDIKTRGRLLMNEFTLSENSLYTRLMKVLSKQFNIEEELIGSLSSNDFVELIENGKIDLTEAHKRQACFVMAGVNDKLVEFDYEESLKICKDFFGEIEGVEHLHGVIASKGLVNGKAIVIPYQIFTEKFIQEKIEQMEEWNILVAHTTSPELIELCKKAKAIVTDQGGLGSHAAIVSRELGIPCIVGTKKATNLLKNGDQIEVNANEGFVRLIKDD